MSVPYGEPEPPILVDGNDLGANVYSPKVRNTATMRRQLSRFVQNKIGILVTDIDGTPQSADEDTVALQLYRVVDFTNSDTDGVLTLEGDEGTIAQDSTGEYTFIIPAELANELTLLRCVWTYQVDSVDYEYVDYFEVVERMSVYDTFTEDEKSVVQQTIWRFGDLFDNTVGGAPSFVEEFQTQYGYNRIAQSAVIATQKINAAKQPLTHYRVGLGYGEGSHFPTEWYGLLSHATYLEVLRHFCRTYVEQPNLVGTNVGYADRRDYLNRWQGILSEEKPVYDDMLRQFKRKHMRLGAGSLIIAGGIYGAGSGLFRSGTYVSQVRGFRMYPALPSVSYGSR
jgi:hypothetical protein